MAVFFTKCPGFRTIGKMSAWYILTFSDLVTLWFDHMVFFSLPNAQEASLIRRFTSSSTDGTLLSRKTMYSTFSIGAWSSITSLVSLDIIWHFVGLIFIPHFVQASWSMLVVCCKALNVHFYQGGVIGISNIVHSQAVHLQTWVEVLYLFHDEIQVYIEETWRKQTALSDTDLNFKPLSDLSIHHDRSFVFLIHIRDEVNKLWINSNWM